MPQIARSQGTLKSSAKALADLVVGNWYYGFDCLVCSKRFAVFDDKNAGKTQLKFSGGGHILVACPHCSSDRLYGADQVRNFEAA
jgi:DNA-directed RNA polymerase subunit RPC12/RpoP